MSEIGEIPAADSLGVFLRSFPLEQQTAGNALFKQNRVMQLRAVGDNEFEAQIDGEAVHKVQISCETDTGRWRGHCSCPLLNECAHLFAAGKTLLAEHSIAVVNGLAAGVRQSAAVTPLPSNLGRQLSERLKRALTPQETEYLKRLHTIYLRCRQTGQITMRDLQSLELRFGMPLWSRLRPWREFPEDETKFWLCLAMAAKQHMVSIPGFMTPITDLSQMERLLQEERRREHLERWRSLLGSNASDRPAADTQPIGESDFRLVLGPYFAFLEYKPPGTDCFQKPNPVLLAELLAASGDLNIPPEAEFLLLATVQTGASAELRYSDKHHRSVLARLLAKSNLASRIVGEEGQPMRHVEEKLHWELIEPSVSQADYQLRLVQASGHPISKLLFETGTHPVLYVSGNSVFRGPPTPSSLNSRVPTAIPREIMESDAGINFLERLGVTLPPALQARIRRFPVRVGIRCYLERFPDSSGVEVGVLLAKAESDDGRVAWRWGGFHWARRDLPSARTQEDGGIPVYDEDLLHRTEKWLRQLDARPHLDLGVHVRLTKSFPETFSTWLQSAPGGIDIQLEGELASLMQETIKGNVRLDVSESEIDWFDLRVVLDISDTNLTAEEIKLLMAAHGGFVRLQGKGWRRLKFNLSAEDDEQLARLGLSAREFSAEPQRMHTLQLADPAARRFLPEQQAELIQRRASEIKVRVTPEVPPAIRAEFRPYQIEGFHFLAYLAENRFGGILADDMGLGKTLQTLTWIAWLRQRGRENKGNVPPPCLVVCPKSVMDNWRAEAVKFAPELRVKVWIASQLSTLREQLAESDVHVLNYSQLRMISETLGSIDWLAAILDEGQYIKNPNSQTAQIARSLRATHRLILSGTPIENRLLDLWSLMSFAMPGVLGRRQPFSRIYGAKEDPFARRRLAARVRPFLLRRTKGQVARDLPARIEEDLFCEMEGEQRALYQAELKRAQQILLAVQTQKELAQFQFHFLASLLRLRQICCHPRLYKPDLRAPGAKLEALVEQLEPLMEEGHKVLVFSQFVELLKLVEPVVKDHGWPVFFLSGATEDRGELVNQFQQSNGPAIFLISLKAGGFGLNLTAASYVVLFDPWWNPAVENQAIDRTHRIGQNQTVIAYRLLIKDSIEEKIRRLQKNKSALADDVLGEERFAQSLTLDEVRYLFADS